MNAHTARMSKLEFPENEFAQVRSQAEEAYAKIGEVLCPYLGAKVEFNVAGLEHIKYQQWNRGRPFKDQLIRFRLLRLVPIILGKSHTLQGIEKVRKRERVKVLGKWQTRVSRVHYYEFTAVIENYRIKVIVRKMGDGPYHFWSIIPSWKQRRNRKKLFDGNYGID